MTIPKFLAPLPAVQAAGFRLPTAFAIGAIAGISTAVLAAARPGAKLRAQLQHRVQTTLQRLRA